MSIRTEPEEHVQRPEIRQVADQAEQQPLVPGLSASHWRHRGGCAAHRAHVLGPLFSTPAPSSAMGKPVNSLGVSPILDPHPHNVNFSPVLSKYLKL